MKPAREYGPHDKATVPEGVPIELRRQRWQLNQLAYERGQRAAGRLPEHPEEGKQ